MMIALIVRISQSAQVYSEEQTNTIVIDAGHGGRDPGAIGITGVLEADINLEMAKRLKEVFERSGYNVIMIREGEDSLAEHKKEDMAARRKIIEESGAAAAVSIHQNCFIQDPDCIGPQVFYDADSEQGRILADYVQQELNAATDEEKTRLSKESSYYIVESGSAPAVLVECGFLSNSEEEQLLTQPQYQLKLVKAIAKGVMSYLDEHGG